MSKSSRFPGSFSGWLCRLSLAVFAVSLLVEAGCAAMPGRAASPPAYRERLDQLRRDFEKSGHPADASIHYVPGVVRKTLPEEVVVDPASGAEVVRNECVVALAPGNSDVDFARALHALGVDAEIVGFVPTFNLVQLHVGGLDAGVLARIMALPMVLWAGDHHVQKADQEAAAPAAPPTPWYLNNFGIPQLQAVGDGRGVTIAVIDSGIDISLPAFRDRVVAPYSVVTTSRDFEDKVYTTGGDVTRVIDHGTRVAFMASAVAPGASLLPIQVFGWSVLDGKLLANDLTVVEGIARAIAFGANVVNLSLGTDYSRFIRYGSPVMGDLDSTVRTMALIGHGDAELFRRVLAECRKRNILVVCAAGNDGIGDASVQPLVASGMTIVAGAIDADNIVAGFSNRGRLVDCFAPGVGLDLEGAGGTRFSVSGTSFSAPFVAGVLALARSAELDLDAQSAKDALRGASAEGRFSILPGESTRIFCPAGLFRKLGAQVPDSGTAVEMQYRFAQSYGRYFIEENDPERKKLDKILGYYAARRWLFETSEAEYQAALAIAPRQVDLLIERVEKADVGDYAAALLLADITFPADKLDAFASHAADSDYVAIVVRRNAYAEGVHYLHDRLRTAVTDFNNNTLLALLDIADRSSFPVVAAYLAARQAAVEFREGEEFACETLASLAEGRIDPDTIALIDRSWDRYRAAATADWLRESRGRNIRCATGMVEVLVHLRDRRGLIEAARLLATLDEEEPLSLSADRSLARVFDETRRRSLGDLQELVNDYLPGDMKFSHLAAQSERKQALDRMAEYFVHYSFN